MNRIGYITAILLAVLLCGSCINEEYAGPDRICHADDHRLPGRRQQPLGGDWAQDRGPAAGMDLHREQVPDLSGFPRRGPPAAPARGLPDDADALCGDRAGVRCGKLGLGGDFRPGAARGCRRISGRQLRIDLLLARQWLVAGWRFAEPGAPIPFGRGGRRGTRDAAEMEYCRVCGSDTRRDVRFHCF